MNKFNQILKNTNIYLKKHSPEILTGLGITSFITGTVLAVKATPKALELIDYRRHLLSKENLSVKETIITAYKPYLPSIGCVILGCVCIIGSNRIQYKRNAALATIYTISEKTLLKYKDKVIETVGKKKSEDIDNAISQDLVNEKKIDSSIIMSTKGNTLILDKLSGRYFKSDLDTIRKGVNKINRDMNYQNYISLNEFYNEIGLENTSVGEYLGWNLSSGLVEPVYNTCLTDTDEPCIVLSFMVDPSYDFDKLI